MGFDIQQDTIYAHDRYTYFYELELAGFRDDLPFYLKHLPGSPATVLELGCGTGRLGRALAQAGHQVTGIDLSHSMLRRALERQDADTDNPRYCCMDMTSIGLSCRFDAVVVPYHTMNLLTGEGEVDRCLAQIRPLLAEGGRLLLQLFVPALAHATLAQKKQFQFMIFDRANGSKVIKEILKWREAGSTLINLRETYRIRYQPDRVNEDWQYDYQILGIDAEAWQDHLAKAGFAVTARYGDYDLTPFVAGEHATLLLAAAAG
ncbi:MAG: class I SAM-dependent methyltransferase [Desulfobulbaceae bacterium]|nr:class I SAM-dependent methyltransferase [Desulfobulbaceae bacterium]